MSSRGRAIWIFCPRLLLCFFELLCFWNCCVSPRGSGGPLDPKARDARRRARAGTTRGRAGRLARTRPSRVCSISKKFEAPESCDVPCMILARLSLPPIAQSPKFQLRHTLARKATLNIKITARACRLEAAAQAHQLKLPSRASFPANSGGLAGCC